MASSPPASDDGDRYEDELWKQPTHARLLVSDAVAGCVIGRAGSAIAAVESTSGALVKLSRRGQLLPGTDKRVILVSGLFHQVMDAAELILQQINYQPQGDQVIDDVVLVVPDACCGALIGKAGTVIKSLIKASNAEIMISPHGISYGLQDRLVTITGSLDNQLQAIFLILSELLDDDRYSCPHAGLPFPSYPASSAGRDDYGPDEHVERHHNRPNTHKRSPDNNDDAQESLTIAIAEEYIGAVIGYAGRNIKDIIQATGAWIKTSAKGNFVAGTTDREVVISGTQEAIDAAEVMIMDSVSVVRRQKGGGEKPPVKPYTTPQEVEQQ